jgi:hypothetical protein
MKHQLLLNRCLSAFFVFCFVGTSQAQVVRTFTAFNDYGSQKQCTGAVSYLEYTSTGVTFNTGNVFVAEIIPNTAPNWTSATRIGSFTSTATSGTVAVTYPVTAGDYQVRVRPTNYNSGPFTLELQQVDIKLVSPTPPVSATFSPMSATIAPNTAISLQLNYNTVEGPWRWRIENPQLGVVSQARFPFSNNPQTINLGPSTFTTPGSYTLTLTSLTSVCGATMPNTTAVVNVVTPWLQTGPLSATRVCQGSLIEIPYTASVANYSADFLLEAQASGSNSYSSVIGISAAPSPLRVSLPETVGAGYGLPAGTYRLRLRESNGELIGEPSPTLLTVLPSPAMSFTVAEPLPNTYLNTGGVTLSPGQAMRIDFTPLGGTPPYILNVVDARYNAAQPQSSTVTSYSLATGTTTRWFSPTQPTSYGFSLIDAAGCAFRVGSIAVERQTVPLIIAASPTNTPLIQNRRFNNRCPGSTLPVNYTVVGGQFPNTALKVQILSYTDKTYHLGQHSSVNWQDLVTTPGASTTELSATLPANLKPDFYYLRVVPTNPNVGYEIGNPATPATNFYSADLFAVQSPLKATITTPSPQVVLPTESRNIKVVFEGGRPYRDPERDIIFFEKYWVALTDGVTSLTSQSGQYPTVTVTFPASTQPRTYSITGVGSTFFGECINPVSLSGTVAFQPASTTSGTITPASVSPQLSCNAVFQTAFTTSAVFNAGNQFKVQVGESLQSGWADLPTSGTGSPLSFTLPASFNPSQSGLRIVSTNPAIISSVLQQGFRRFQRYVTEVFGTSSFVEAGQAATVLVRYNRGGEDNLAPTIRLSNGITTFVQVMSGSGGPDFYESPDGQTFRVVTIPNATAGVYSATVTPNAGASCTTPYFPPGSMTVTQVNSPQLSIGPLLSQTACGGDVITVPYSSTRPLNPENYMTASLLTAGGAVVLPMNFEHIPGAVRITLPVRNNLPSLPVTLRLVSVNPNQVSNPLSLTIHSRTTASVNPAGVVTVLKGEAVPLTIGLMIADSPAPNTIAMDGVTGLGRQLYNMTTQTQSLTVVPQQTTNYFPNPVWNRNCVSNAITPGLGVAVIERTLPLEIGQPGIAKLCAGQSLTVSFSMNTTANTGNQFVLQLSDATGQTYTDLTTTQPTAGQLQATLPANLPAGRSYRLRVKATNPLLFSLPTVLPYSNDGTGPLSAVVSGGGTIGPNESAPVSISLTGEGPYLFSLLDGNVNTVIQTASTPFSLRVSPIQTRTYTISNLRNDCQTGTTSGGAIVTVNVPAVICQSLSSGDWHQVARWSCGRVPLVTDRVQINAGHIVTIGAGQTGVGQHLRNHGQLTFGAGGRVVLGN